jgi:ATP-dependent Lon protease
MRIDSTYGIVRFTYLPADGVAKDVTTLEEEEFPNYYHKTTAPDDEEKVDESARLDSESFSSKELKPAVSILEAKHLAFKENQKGLSFDNLFGAYLKGANQITVTDPYIRLFYQLRNFMEFLESVVKYNSPGEEVSVHLITTRDEFKAEQQLENFEKMRESASSAGVIFTWEFDSTGTIHARHIVTDHGWKISLDRGLDIFQPYEMNDAFSFANRLQEFRPCKAFEVTFIKQ